MTYILDMASGTELSGERVRCPSAGTPTDTPSGVYRSEVDLGLTPVQAETTQSVATTHAEALHLEALIRQLED